ncbi:hypothetical protein, variant [Exophiala oligosperma]|nr:hypothetical protein, variant [Exophiala oligosperma]KIW36100.1 hypothetical protein, variant [Exophiala oligosperma]
MIFYSRSGSFLWACVCCLSLFDWKTVYTGASPVAERKPTFDWAKLAPSAVLNWTQCFENYTCTKLKVPLDYENPSIGSTGIAFIKLAAKNNSDTAPNILINQGGPGGSGVDFLLSTGSELEAILGSDYNIVGFDPRGVNNSGPVVDCFPRHSDAREEFSDQFFTVTANSSSNSLEQQFYAADLFGQWCSAAFRKNASGEYVSTPAVATDMLTYAKAEQRAAGKPEEEAKLWYYAVSYGTALGSTFAALYPQNVGRLVLDGVLDAEDYFNGAWESNLYQSDDALGTFSTYCHQAGPNNCSFWGPSSQNITDRLDVIISTLRDHPLPVAGVDSEKGPGLATYADLKQLLLWAVYAPVQRFPELADALKALESGDGSQVMNGLDNVVVTDDEDTIIKCVDGYRGTDLSTLEAYQNYVTLLEKESHYFGDAWPTNADNVLCRSVNLTTTDKRAFSGFLHPTRYNTSFPILYVASTIDPVTPTSQNPPRG